MDCEIAERRAEVRFPAALCRIEAATLRPGFSVRVIDVSARGAQVQCQRPLRPGGRVHVRLVCGHGIVALSAVIVRCTVWTLDPETGVVYRGALHFDDACAPFGGCTADAPMAGAAGLAADAVPCGRTGREFPKARPDTFTQVS